MTVSHQVSDIFLPTYRGRLTEGITYNPKNNTVLWVDIIASEVHRVSLSDPTEATHQVLKFTNKDDQSYNESIGAIALTNNDDKVLLCAKYGVAIGDFVTQEASYIVKYPGDQTKWRSNDGIIDPWGNLWIGTMSDFTLPKELEGKVFHINCKTLEVTTMLTHCQIANGLAFSEDGKTFFWTDLKTYTIFKFDYDYKTNTLSNKREYINTKKEAVGKLLQEFDSPEPDGFTMTKDEHIYGAVFSTSKLLHYGPTGGNEVLEEFQIPAKKVTCCIIANNDTLLINTAQTFHGDASKCEPATNKEGDLGGFLFQIKLQHPVQAQVKNIWQGQV